MIKISKSPRATHPGCGMAHDIIVVTGDGREIWAGYAHYTNDGRPRRLLSVNVVMEYVPASERGGREAWQINEQLKNAGVA